MSTDKPKAHERVVFVKWFRHHLTGKIIYPRKGKVIALRIKE